MKALSEIKSGVDMEFEKLLCEHKGAAERFVYFRIKNKQDAEDILQDTFFTAFTKFDMLKNKDCFKAWLLSIARNKCNDYYRKSMGKAEISGMELSVFPFEQSRYGIAFNSNLQDVFSSLKDKDREILYKFYYLELPQKEIAQQLNIPVGTVKSRLYNAKKHFKLKYPNALTGKGDKVMNLPKKMPEYKIIKSDKEPFSVQWEELMGWLIIPRPDEKISWALYDQPQGDYTEYVEMQVTGKAVVHGIAGVVIKAKEYSTKNEKSFSERCFVAQLTDTHCRILAESHKENGVNKYYTFLDGDEFIKNWGFGEDNCGKEINLSVKNRIKRNINIIESDENPYCMDIVGRYTVIIGNMEFDTVCLMDIESYDTGVVTEQYIDKNGKTVLWRRFNENHWAFNRYNKSWSEMLPDNEQLTVNGRKYVHWYDCISDYIM